MATAVTESRSSGGESSPLLRRDADNGCGKNGGECIDDIECHNRETTTPANKGDGDDKVLAGSAWSWLRLWLFFAACVVSGGILPGQNVYSRLLCEAGLFSYACRLEDNDGGGVGGANAPGDFITTVSEHETGGSSCCSAQWLLLANTMNALSVTITFFFFLGGLLFDTVGGQWASVVGCGINAAGFFLLSALLFGLQQYNNDGGESSVITPWMETTIFCFAVILVDAGSIITNVSFFGFLWHFPRHQALVLSLSNCCLNVAALVPLVLRFILRRYESWLSLPSVIFLYAIAIVGIATPTCWATVPSIENYRSRAVEVLGMPIPRRTIWGIRGAIQSVKAGIRILKHHARLHFFTLGTFIFAWMSSLVYMTMSDPLGQEIFGTTGSIRSANDTTEGGMVVLDNRDRDGERFATLYNQCSAMVGLFIGPVLGVMLDRYSHPTDGITDLAVIVTISMAIIGVFCSVADWTVQTIVVTAGAFGQIAVLLVTMRYAVIFAPPNRVGAVSGILMASLGGLCFPLFLLLSVYIGLSDSYLGPNVALNLIGAAIWVSYIVFLKRTKPWPSSPVFLPEDERNIAKMFAVGTLEDAAFVAGKSLQEFRRLSSSSKIVDQRALLDAAFATEAGERIMEVARRRSSKEISKRQSICCQASASSNSKSFFSEPDVFADSFPTSDSVASRYPIPLHLASGIIKGEEFTIRRGTASSALETIEISFNGHGGFGGRNEPLMGSIFASIGPPDDPRRIAITHSFFAPMFCCAETHGTILEVRVGGITAASCACFHPDGLENGSIYQVGSDRYYYSLAMSGATPTMNRETMGTESLQRFVATQQDARWDEKRKEYGPMFYIAVLGVHPSYQGRGYGKKLLNIVANWADREDMDCYLECSEKNVPIYEKCGYENVWRVDVKVEGSYTMANFGMARKYQERRDV